MGAISKRNASNEYGYLMKDALGTVRNLVDADKVIRMNYKYDIFGAIREAIGSDPIGIPQTFTGKELDTDSGLHYFGARSYDSAIGRFITPDTWTCGPDDVRWVGSSITESLGLLVAYRMVLPNMYCYCFNSPINWADPNGHITPVIAGLIAGAVMGGIIGFWVGLALQEPGESNWEVVKSVIFGVVAGAGSVFVVAAAGNFLLACVIIGIFSSLGYLSTTEHFSWAGFWTSFVFGGLFGGLSYLAPTAPVHVKLEWYQLILASASGNAGTIGNAVLDVLAKLREKALSPL